MLDLVGNPEDRSSHVMAQMKAALRKSFNEEKYLIDSC